MNDNDNKNKIKPAVGKLATLLLSITLCLAVTEATLAAPRESNRFIVKFRAEPDFSASALPSPAAMKVLDRVEIREQLQSRLLKKLRNGAQVIEIDQAFSQVELYQFLHRLNQDDLVEYAEPDLWMVPSVSIPEPQEQWYLASTDYGIDVETAWDLSTGDGAVVAVVDSGIVPHEDLLANLIPGYDFISDIDTAADGDGRDADASDPGDYIPENTCDNDFEILSSWHGTQVAGVIAAADNSIGIVGVAPDAKLMSLRVLGRCGGYSSDIIDAIEWAVDEVSSDLTVDVLNLSLNSDQSGVCGNAYQRAIDKALAADVLVVVSAGNNGATGEYPPANCEGVLAVTASNRQGEVPDYAGRGGHISLAAPGGQQRTFADLRDFNGIVTTGNDSLRGWESGKDSYVQVNGTSFSAAVVSGVAALLRSQQPTLTVDEMKAAILTSTKPFPQAVEDAGIGILDAAAALALVVVPDPTDLAVSMLGTNGVYVPALEGGGAISYQVMVQNQSEQLATQVQLQLILPEQPVSFVAIQTESDGSCDLATGLCEWGELAPGAEVVVHVVVQTEVRDFMIFSAQVVSAEEDLTATDNQISAQFGGALNAVLLILLSGFLLRGQRRE